LAADSLKKLKDDIKDGRFGRVYLLYGEEGYLRRHCRRELADALLPEGDSINRLELRGEKARFEEIISFADTLPFLAPRRIIVCEGTGLFKKASDELADYLKNVPEHSVIIFSEESVDKRGRLYKAAAANGAVVEFPYRDARQLMDWSARILKGEGLSIRRTDMEFFISRCGKSMDEVSRATDKLVNFAKGRAHEAGAEASEVTRADIEAVTVPQPEDRIFEMLRCVIDGDAEGAFSRYSELLKLRTAPMLIITLMGKEYGRLLLIKDLLKRGRARGEIAKAMNLRDFMLRRLMPQAEKLSDLEIRRALEACASADEDIKSGRMGDKLAAEVLLLRLLQKQRTRGAR